MATKKSTSQSLLKQPPELVLATGFSRSKKDVAHYLDIFANVINTIADPIFVKDRQHRFQLMNDAVCDFIGHSREELIGKSDFDFFPEEEARVFWQMDDDVFECIDGNDLFPPPPPPPCRFEFNDILSSDGLLAATVPL